MIASILCQAALLALAGAVPVARSDGDYPGANLKTTIVRPADGAPGPSGSCNNVRPAYLKRYLDKAHQGAADYIFDQVNDLVYYAYAAPRFPDWFEEIQEACKLNGGEFTTDDSSVDAQPPDSGNDGEDANDEFNINDETHDIMKARDGSGRLNVIIEPDNNADGLLGFCKAVDFNRFEGILMSRHGKAYGLPALQESERALLKYPAEDAVQAPRVLAELEAICDTAGGVFEARPRVDRDDLDKKASARNVPRQFIGTVRPDTLNVQLSNIKLGFGDEPLPEFE